MKVLFVHIDFPSQYEHLARWLAAQPGNEVVAIANAQIAKPAKWPAGVKQCIYQPPALDTSRLSAGEQTMMTASRLGHAAARAAIGLRDQGFTPELILAHSGTGEAMFLRDVFPRARTIAYCEIVHRPENSIGFDREVEYPADAALTMRLSLAPVLLSLDAAERGVAPTRWQRDVFPAPYQPRIAVIHDGVDTDRVAPNPAATFPLPGTSLILSRRDEVVTFVSRSLEPLRGFHSFMRALPIIQRRRPNARTVIVGADEVSYSPRLPSGESWRARLLRDLEGELDLSRVDFPGRIAWQSYLALLQVSSAHLYLTYPYILGWSCIEALAAGCVVVGSRTAPVQEVITDRRNGLLADFFSPNEIADRVVEALEDRDGMQPLRDAARRTALEQYDFQRVCLPRHLELMREVLR